MAGITYVKGDATNPVAPGNKIIAHICNTIGGWGKGFVLAISKKWKAPEREYRKWYNSGVGFALGEVQLVSVNSYISVVNMIAQQGIHTGSKGPPIRYGALERCLTRLAELAVQSNASVHMPRIGCGLAGGKWELVEPIVQRTLIQSGVDVYVYDLG